MTRGFQTQAVFDLLLIPAISKQERIPRQKDRGILLWSAADEEAPTPDLVARDFSDDGFGSTSGDGFF